MPSTPVLDVATVKALLGIKTAQNDTQLAALINPGLSVTSRVCSVTLGQSTYTEQRNGGGKRFIVDHPPISKTDPLIVWDDPTRTFDDSTQLDASIYSVNYAAGVIAVDSEETNSFASWVTVGECFSPGNLNIQVQYVGGIAAAAVPDDLKLLAAEIIGQLLFRLGNAGVAVGIKGESADAFDTKTLSIASRLTLQAYQRTRGIR